jgi:hypothetical protein
MRILLLLTFTVTLSQTAFSQSVDQAVAARFADLALTCVHQEYPNKIGHVMASDEDVAPPRDLTPAFHGCFDWHSAVHGHWMLVRLARLHPAAAHAELARSALQKSLTSENLLKETAYFEPKGRQSFERPYGMAWLLQLSAELREWDDPQAARWLLNLAPLEKLLEQRLDEWLNKLSHPIRTGEHSQTAFAFGLYRDWAVAAGKTGFVNLLDRRIHDFYDQDRDCPLAYEPSGQDFLSPCLAEADLMRRVLTPAAYAQWLTHFMPGIPTDGDGSWLAVSVVTDKSDGKLAHLDGLNLSRAWMLEGMASGLPDGDQRRAAILAAARSQSEAGLAAVTGEHYAGGHWLGSFATYLVTRRGIPETAN